MRAAHTGVLQNNRVVVRIIKGIAEAQRFTLDAQANSKQVGFVPTMGNLHDGHLALIRQAQIENECIIVSIFVNPLQFGPQEDFDAYPRTIEVDIEKIMRLGIDAVFIPNETDMYPNGRANCSQVLPPPALASNILCAQSRPHFFQGVATIVLKLLHAVPANRAYFGEKDYQQLLVIRALVQDFNLSTYICQVPTVRESSGLAMSSRNNYLSKEDRQKAGMLLHTMQESAQCLEQSNLSLVIELAKKTLATAGFLLEYFEFRHAQTLELVTEQSTAIEENIRLFAAVRLNQVRLIDNIPV